MKKSGKPTETPIKEDHKSTDTSKHAEIKPDILVSEKDEEKKAEEKMRQTRKK